MSDKIVELKDEYEGERVFIIGNGPSLAETPINQLNDEYTLAMNKIHLMYSDIDWRPSFYLTPWEPDYYKQRVTSKDVDPIRLHSKLGIPTFIHHKLEQKYCSSDIYYIKNFRLQLDGIPFHEMSMKDMKNINIDELEEYWSYDISNLVYEYHAMYVAGQIAVYMGFDHIYLLGADLGREYIDPHMIFESGLDPYHYENGKMAYLRDALDQDLLIRSIVNGIAMKLIQNSYPMRVYNSIDSNYFDSGYNDDLKIKDLAADDREIEKSHVAIKRICERNNINIYNATIGGELDVYERVNITDII